MNRLRILFIDDDKLILALTSVALRRLGHVADCFADALEAATAFATSPPRYDLVICDARLDGASGFDLAARLHGFHPEIPILMISGAVNHDDVERAREVGALAVLSKSEVMTDLPAAIRRLLGA